MKMYKMEVFVACNDEADYKHTALAMSQTKLFTSEMLRSLCEMKRKDPDTVNAVIVAAGRKDYVALARVLGRKLNPLNN
ncbi:MAG: hypothetical protein SNG97_06390 [Rikenellaceae bacterium]